MEWTGLEFSKGQWRTGKMEKFGCKIICGAPAILAIKGLMMMMMVRTRAALSLNSKADT